MAIKLYRHENKLLFKNLQAVYKNTTWFHSKTVPYDVNDQWQNFKFWLWSDYNVWSDIDQYGTYVKFDTDEQRVEFLLKWL